MLNPTPAKFQFCALIPVGLWWLAFAVVPLPVTHESHNCTPSRPSVNRSETSPVCSELATKVTGTHLTRFMLSTIHKQVLHSNPFYCMQNSNLLLQLSYKRIDDIIIIGTLLIILKRLLNRLRTIIASFIH